MRRARFYLMITASITADAVYLLRYLVEHLHRATVTAYRAAGESWWVGEMKVAQAADQDAET